MNIIKICLIISIVYLSYQVRADGFKCNQILNRDAVYSLELLSSTTDYKYEIKPNERKIYYNFCTTTVKKCDAKDVKAYAVLVEYDPVSKNETKCSRLTDDSVFSG